MLWLNLEHGVRFSQLQFSWTPLSQLGCFSIFFYCHRCHRHLFHHRPSAVIALRCAAVGVAVAAVAVGTAVAVGAAVAVGTVAVGALWVRSELLLLPVAQLLFRCSGSH